MDNAGPPSGSETSNSQERRRSRRVSERPPGDPRVEPPADPLSRSYVHPTQVVAPPIAPQEARVVRRVKAQHIPIWTSSRIVSWCHHSGCPGHVQPVPCSASKPFVAVELFNQDVPTPSAIAEPWSPGQPSSSLTSTSSPASTASFKTSTDA